MGSRSVVHTIHTATIGTTRCDKMVFELLVSIHIHILQSMPATPDQVASLAPDLAAISLSSQTGMHQVMGAAVRGGHV